MCFDLHPQDGTPQYINALLAGPDSPQARANWLAVLKAIAQGLGSSVEVVEPFITAWCGLYTVTLQLDHIQDGDAISPAWFAELPSALQYQLVFSSYAHVQKVAAGPYPAVPAQRVVRLHQLWTALVVEMAEGQYRDLTESVATVVAAGQSSLDAYETIIELKAGSLFALGFGGVATLATDDEQQISAAIDAGRLFGMLLQYGDDLLDTSAQEHQPSTVTLPRAFQSLELGASEVVPSQVFWEAIYRSYARALPTILAPLPAAVRDAIRDLVNKTFAAPRTSSRVRTADDEAHCEP